MSAGSTFGRVYAALKDELLRGDHRPGEPLEPRLLGSRLLASVTPVRDALHRLAGEGLVEASPHDGFRIPLMTEDGLRDLYRWQDLLASLALRQAPSPPAMAEPDTAPDPPARLRRLFETLARAAASPELARATATCADRLSPAWRREPQLFPDLREELDQLERATASGDRPGLRQGLARYRTTRLRAVPQLVTLLNAGPAGGA